MSKHKELVTVDQAFELLLDRVAAECWKLNVRIGLALLGIVLAAILYEVHF